MADQDLYEMGFEDGQADTRDGGQRPLPTDVSYLAGYQAGVDHVVAYRWASSNTITIRVAHPTAPAGPQLVAGVEDTITINGVPIRLRVKEATYADGVCSVLAEVLDRAAYEDAVRTDDDIDDIIANHPWDL